MDVNKTLTIPKALMELEPEWKTNKVVIKMLNYRDVLKIQDSSIDLKVDNRGIKKLDLYTETAGITKIRVSVTEAPWKRGDNETIANFKGVFAQWLSNEIDAFNTVSLTEKKNGV